MSVAVNNTVVKKKKKMTAGRVIFILALTVIPTINFLVFYMYVNINSFLLGFQREIGGQIVWTLENFVNFIGEFSKENSILPLSFRNTFITFGISLLLFPVGVSVSYFLYKKIPLFKTFRVLFFLPSILPGVVVSTVFLRLVGVNGIIAQTVQNILGLDYVPELLGQTRFANKTIFSYMIWFGIPGNMILWGGAFARIPDSVLESARLDGVGWIREAFNIIVPMVWPTFSIMLLFQFSGIFGASGQVFLLTKGEWGTQTFSNWLFMEVLTKAQSSNNRNAFSYMSAIGMIVSLLSITIALTVKKITSKMFQDVEY